MDYKIIWSRYPCRHTTTWYVWSDGNRVVASTRKRDLPGPSHETYRFFRRETKIVFACPSCGRHHDAPGYAKLAPEAAKMARDCREYRQIMDAFRRYPALAEAALRGDPRASEMAERHARSARKREQGEAGGYGAPILGENEARSASQAREVVRRGQQFWAEKFKC